jgi:hypothetical protein
MDRQATVHRAAQQAAGVQGEDILAWSLSVLPDEWMMLRGYRNRRGETDHVLVGPHGLWAVEVKRRRVRLHVDGDRWWFEKLDRRGRAVDTDWAVDGGGRSWARQVNDIAADLSSWLERNNRHVPVRTAVMLMHEGAQLGQIRNLTVSVVGTHPTHMLDAIAAYSTLLSQPECAAIVDLIRRDHTHHQNRRRR